jgi:hypothetical protein
MGKVLSAQGSGYFPSCLQEMPESTLGIVTASLSNIMKLYWRVKSWKIDSITGSFKPNAEYDAESFSYNVIEKDLTQVSEITQENQYVCNPVYSAFVIIDYNYVLNGIPYPATSPFNFAYGDDFYYGYGIALGIGFQYNVNNSWGSSERSGQIGTFNINPFGISVPLYSYNDGPPRVPSGNVVVNMSPREYWSYDGTYDTATGNPL